MRATTCANIGLAVATIFCIVVFVLFFKYATISAPAKACVYSSKGDLKFCI